MPTRPTLHTGCSFLSSLPRLVPSSSTIFLSSLFSRLSLTSSNSPASRTKRKKCNPKAVKRGGEDNRKERKITSLPFRPVRKDKRHKTKTTYAVLALKKRECTGTAPTVPHVCFWNPFHLRFFAFLISHHPKRTSTARSALILVVCFSFIC